MSVAPHVATPERRVNDYTVVIEQGARDGLSEGDSVILAIGDEHVRSTVVDVTERKSVLEINTA
jgi:cell shape-determining protein MreC